MGFDRPMHYKMIHNNFFGCICSKLFTYPIYCWDNRGWGLFLKIIWMNEESERADKQCNI